MLSQHSTALIATDYVSRDSVMLALDDRCYSWSSQTPAWVYMQN